MPKPYNVIDSDDGDTVASFLTSLSRKPVESIMDKATKIYAKEDRYKVTIFFELMKKQDREFQEVFPEEVVI